MKEFWTRILPLSKPGPIDDLNLGSLIDLGNKVTLKILTEDSDFLWVKFSEPVIKTLNDIGHTPLPPYIKRMPDADDKERYQTVFAKEWGAVAAPTAGLHFNRGLLMIYSRERGTDWNGYPTHWSGHVYASTGRATQNKTTAQRTRDC